MPHSTLAGEEPRGLTGPRQGDKPDFFAPNVFQTVLRDPTTVRRLKSFCDSKACGENIAFLEKVDQYNRLLEQARKLLSEIHTTFTSPDATEPINIPETISRGLNTAISTSTQSTLPALQDVFVEARKHVERTVGEDVYPRFVTHQVTSSAAMALSQDRTAFRGLGDCFCLTDPAIADNPIVYASDGFIDVTGYSRRDIVPRNCRFLQGTKTDQSSVARLRSSIKIGQESVELLLNYRKDGSPFWNLLYVAPLRDETGNIVFFLGGQIDCSTTIYSNPDVLRVLGFDGSKQPAADSDEPAAKSYVSNSPREQFRRHRSMFKSITRSPIMRQDGAGMESGLVNRIGNMSIKTQMEAFQTAYSKYLVLKAGDNTALKIAHFSTSAAELLHLSRAQGTTEPIANEHIFKVLGERSSWSSSVSKSYRRTIAESLARGKAVSMDLELLVLEKSASSAPKWPIVKIEKRFVSHWTPCKDENGRAKYVVLILAER